MTSIHSCAHQLEEIRAGAERLARENTELRSHLGHALRERNAAYSRIVEQDGILASLQAIPVRQENSELRAEVERLRGVLRDMLHDPRGGTGVRYLQLWVEEDAMDAAKQALEVKP